MVDPYDDIHRDKCMFYVGNKHVYRFCQKTKQILSPIFVKVC